MVLGQDGLAYYERNADEPIKIASVTKVMTALVALEHCELTDNRRSTHAAATVGESSLGLLEGDALTMEDALTGLMVMSGNDAATAIAIARQRQIDPATTDPYSTFIEAMNQKAKGSWAARIRFFENPHGLDFDSWGGRSAFWTTRDITAVFSAAHEKTRASALLTTATARRFSVTSADGTQRHACTLTVRNQIHGQEGNIGGKTGTTMEAGNGFVVRVLARERRRGLRGHLRGSRPTCPLCRHACFGELVLRPHRFTVPYINTPVTRNGVPLVGEATCRRMVRPNCRGFTLEDPNVDAQRI